MPSSRRNVAHGGVAVDRLLYRVNVDVAGGRGWGGRSRRVFVVSAMIVSDHHDAELRRAFEGINKAFGPEAVITAPGAHAAHLEQR
jgi:hypothetical protein